MIDFSNKVVTGSAFAEEIKAKAIDKHDGRTQMEGALLSEWNKGMSVADMIADGKAQTPLVASMIGGAGSFSWLSLLLQGWFGWSYHINSPVTLNGNIFLDAFRECPCRVGEYIKTFAKIIGINKSVHPFESVSKCNTFNDLFLSKEAFKEICACQPILDILRYMYPDETAIASATHKCKIYLIKDGYFFAPNNSNEWFAPPLYEIPDSYSSGRPCRVVHGVTGGADGNATSRRECDTQSLNGVPLYIMPKGSSGISLAFSSPDHPSCIRNGTYDYPGVAIYAYRKDLGVESIYVSGVNRSGVSDSTGYVNLRSSKKRNFDNGLSTKFSLSSNSADGLRWGTLPLSSDKFYYLAINQMNIKDVYLF